MKFTCSNCKCAFDPAARHEPFCPRCVEAAKKTAIDKPTIRPQMGDQGAMGDAVEVNRKDWISVFITDMKDCEYLVAEFVANVEKQLRLRYERRNQWTSEMPTSEGEYEIRCNETDGRAERVMVYYRISEASRGPFLAVNDDMFGFGYPIEQYHDGLTDLEWRRIQ